MISSRCFAESAHQSVRSDTCSERVSRLSFVANFGEKSCKPRLGAFHIFNSRIDGNRPSVVQRFGIKCPQKWSGGAPRWAIFPETSTSRRHSAVRGAWPSAGEYRRPSVRSRRRCETTAVVWSGIRWTERTPEWRVFDKTPSPLFSFGAGYFRQADGGRGGD